MLRSDFIRIISEKSIVLGLVDSVSLVLVV